MLAIAGLIFLMVFVALPALQKSQRDTQRRNDYAMLAASVINYATNNGGSISKLGGTEPKSITKTMINDTGKDPNGKDYVLNGITGVPATGAPVPSESNVFIFVNADCSGEKDGFAAPANSSAPHAFAIYGYLEGGTYCSAERY